jgi:hypothetical protein
VAAATDPRRFLGRVLARFGFDGGNARAVANVRRILDDQQTARERIDALEVRVGHRASAGLGAGWHAIPPAGQPPRPALLELEAWPTDAQPVGTSINGHSSKASHPHAKLSSNIFSIT